MQKAVRLSKFLSFLLAVIVAFPVGLCAEEAVQFKKNETSLGRDIFEQNFYYEGTSYLRLDRLYRAVFHKKAKAKNINVFDEVPDNTFFTNRHARKALSASEIEKGTVVSSASAPFTIEGGYFGEVGTYLLAKDKDGNDYYLKFDHADHVELETGAEIVANRIYHALGYNVPEETIMNLEAGQLVPGANAEVFDGTGFSKKLTQDKLDQHLMFVAQNEEGRYRVVASKLVKGDHLGGFHFQGRRRNDPHDGYDHEARRELRALYVFAAWLNHTNLRPENTMDVLVDENGAKIIKHYLTDVDASLGADSHGAKPASFGYEYFADFGETGKAVLGLGIWEKPWQKRWKEAGEKTGSAAVGYFDNRRFNPEKFKTVLPSYSFKDLTRADGFWAAKQMMSLKDADIEAAVKAASYSNAEDAQTISKILSQRRDILGRYWFSESNSLDLFDIQGGKLVFEDLAVTHRFAEAEGTVYHVDVIAKQGKRGKKINAFTSTEPSFALDSNGADYLIRVSRSGAKPGPYVLVETAGGKVSGVTRQD